MIIQGAAAYRARGAKGALITKGSNTNRTNSVTTLTLDPELQFNAVSGRKYHVLGYLVHFIANAGGDPGILYSLGSGQSHLGRAHDLWSGLAGSAPGGWAINGNHHIFDNADNEATGMAIGGVSTNTDCHTFIDWTFKAGTTAATGLVWRINNLGAGGSITVKAGSWLHVTEEN